MHPFHIPQCFIQNRNVHISVLNGELWDMEQVHSGIDQLDELTKCSETPPKYVCLVGLTGQIICPWFSMISTFYSITVYLSDVRFISDQCWCSLGDWKDAVNTCAKSEMCSTHKWMDIRNVLTYNQNCGYPDNKFHGANMGPTWGQQDPGGPHIGPMNFANAPDHQHP